jgi:hypothetical protein
MQNDELLRKYVMLELSFKALEEQKKALREEIVEDFKKKGLEKVNSEFGSFTICNKTSWKYSESIKSLENKVKIAKDKEQKKGIAKVTISEYLLFKENI